MTALKCKFGGNGRDCVRVADPDGMCPRHSAMVRELGRDRAIAVEYAVICDICGEIYKADELMRCGVCLTNGVCVECVSVGACCDEKRERLSE